MIIGARPTVARSHAIAHREESPLRNFWYSRDLTRTCTVRWESWSCILLGWCVGNVTRCGNGTGKKTPGGAGTHKQGTHGTHRNTDHTDDSTSQAQASLSLTTTQPASRRPDPTSTHEEHEHAQKAQSVTHTHSHTISIPHLRKDHPQRSTREPDPAASRSQSASPRLLESGRRKKARRACSKAEGYFPVRAFATPDVHVCTGQQG